MRGKEIDISVVENILSREKIRFVCKSSSLNKGYQEFIYEINSKKSNNLTGKLSVVAGIEGINIVSGVNI